MRECPRNCGPLQARESSGIEVDLCPVCEGIWLDAGEFDPLVSERFAGEPLEQFWRESAAGSSSRDGAACPVDASRMVLVEFMSMELDWCEECHGVWIDGLERAQLSTEKPAEPIEHELELDFEAVQQVQRVEDVDVVCGACAEVVSRMSAMKRMDAFWCEACVIRGDYPGSHGPPVSQRMAEAARLLAQGEASQAERRQAQRALKDSLQSRGWMRGSPPNDVGIGVGAVARSLKTLFFGDKDR